MNELRAWVRDKNEKNDPFDHNDVKKWVLDKWGLDVTVQTNGNYLHHLDLTRKTCQVKTAGFKYTKPELRAMYWR